MSRYVMDGGRLLPRIALEPELNPPRGACMRCGGTGSISEQVNSARYDVMVPCQMCQSYCKTCGRYRKRVHICQPETL